MEEQEKFYTMKGYQQNSGAQMTASMEDYLEMICRMAAQKEVVRISALAGKLHVKPSSASKMVNNLRDCGYLKCQKYGYIALTEKGEAVGNYLLYRHKVLHDFLCALNQTENELEQAEKIEHFLNPVTIGNLERLTEHILKKSQDWKEK